MADFDSFMKQINKNKNDDDDEGSDIEDELEKLEREVNKKPRAKGKNKGKKKPKKVDDDDINEFDLSEGDIDDINSSDEDTKKKPQPKAHLQPQPQPQPQSSTEKKLPQKAVSQPKEQEKPEPQPQPPSQPQIQTQPQKKATVPKPSKEKKVEKDIYMEMTEKVYHSVDKMKSMSVLEAEKAICDKIIKFKKDNGFDNFDIWEAKKNMIEVISKKIQNMIENNLLDIDGYKKTITSEMSLNNKLLNFVKKDTKLEPQEIEELTNRLKERIKLIETELSETMEEAEEEGEVKEEVKVDADAGGKEHRTKEEVKVDADAGAKEESKLIETKTNKEKEGPKKDLTKSESETKTEPETEPIPEPKEKKVKINEKLIQELNQRIEEYKLAYTYFKENYLEEQMHKSIKDIKELVLGVKSLEAGKDKEVDEFSLPQGVTPEYIVGCPSKNRITHYKDLINELNAQKIEIAKGLNAMAEKFKGMSKSDFKKIQDFAKKDIEAKKAKIEKYEKIIKMLLENAKNPWIPAPLFSKVTEEEKIEKINETIPEHTMVIHFGITEYCDTKQYLNVILNLGDESKNKTETLYARTKDFFNDRLQWQFEKSEFKYLHRKELEVNIMSKGFLSSKKIGTVKVKLSDLKDKCEKKAGYEIDMEDKKKFPKAPSMQINILLRTPFAEREYIIKTKEVFTVTRIFPPFKGEGMGQSTIVESKQVPYNAPINKIVPQENIEEHPKKTSSKQQHPKGQISKTPSNPKKQIGNKPNVSKSLFKEEELDNPDYIDNLNSIEVLTFKEKEIDERIKKIEGRTPKQLREQFLKIKCKKKVLEDQLGEGAITPSGYMEIIKKQYQHDKLLYDYFEQENMKDKAASVANRLRLLLKETNEMIEYLKKNPE